MFASENSGVSCLICLPCFLNGVCWVVASGISAIAHCHIVQFTQKPFEACGGWFSFIRYLLLVCHTLPQQCRKVF